MPRQFLGLHQSGGIRFTTDEEIAAELAEEKEGWFPASLDEINAGHMTDAQVMASISGGSYLPVNAPLPVTSEDLTVERTLDKHSE